MSFRSYGALFFIALLQRLGGLELVWKTGCKEHAVKENGTDEGPDRPRVCTLFSPPLWSLRRGLPRMDGTHLAPFSAKMCNSERAFAFAVRHRSFGRHR